MELGSSSGPTRLNTTGSTISPCPNPKTTTPLMDTKMMKNKSVALNTNGTVPKNVVNPPTKMDGPMDVSISFTRSARVPFTS